jgi:hypothetical protein
LALIIVILGGWFLLPEGYNDAINILAPHLGNFVRPTLVMVNLLLVNPMNSFTMIAVWAGAGLVGGMMAGTKKGAFVVGLMVWFACLGIAALCVFLIITGDFSLSSIVIPPGTSLIDLLGIPIIQDVIDQILPMVAGLFGGGGGASFDPSMILAILSPVLLWLITPIIIVILAGMLGATIRPKEDF